MGDSKLEEELRKEKKNKEEIIKQKKMLHMFEENCELDLQDTSSRVREIENSRYASQLQEVTYYYYNLIKSNALDFKISSMKYEAELKSKEEKINRNIEEITSKIKKKKENNGHDK